MSTTLPGTSHTRLAPERPPATTRANVVLGAERIAVREPVDVIAELGPRRAELVRGPTMLVQGARRDLTPMLTHRLPLARITVAYELFAARRDGVLKVAVTP